MQVVLYIEEYQLARDISQYDLFNCSKIKVNTRTKGMNSIELPGLSEKARVNSIIAFNSILLTVCDARGQN